LPDVTDLTQLVSFGASGIVASSQSWSKGRVQKGWFAARPYRTENIYKIYCESFRDEAHLDAIVKEEQET
jgi:phosphoglucomutase